MNRSIVRILPLFFLLMLLAACDSAPPCGQSTSLTTLCSPVQSLTISGTVSAPAGGDIANTVVRACPVLGGDGIACSEEVTQRITQSGPSASYSLTVSPGYDEYALFAEQDGDGDGTPEAEGIYRGFVTPPASEIDIQLEAVN